eukprot:CAMPEP_0184350832 /NCGR_PEP_ID=MMETSP1089-20130417/42380_1 /TAXON_ID=38269 ORGANISM="Gloeochaete wittrockiana, Strain SAG46.84" /NCGR_SAMPLE_ID=MMETSP1089 /ASSEMBLY_ACC=CAM_ASM_000445 /LENGTH=316 /DNA_ID=CAMNT_0026683903 /DNA_START=44 /DNA_END=994 /DNA_ORIENTATION=+
MHDKKVDFQGHQVVELQRAGSIIHVCPEKGGRLLDWTVEGTSIIYWPNATNWAHVPKTRGGNPILFPFIARHMVDGIQGKWRNEEGKVFDLPNHGFARESDFKVVESEPNAIRMRLTDSPETRAVFPFSFQFEVEYKLTAENELQVAFITTNTGDKDLPYYAGHHFYFAIPKTDREKWAISMPLSTGGRQTADGSVTFFDISAPDRQTTLADPSLVDRFNLHGNPPADIPAGTQVQLSNPEHGRKITLALGPSASDPDTISTAAWYDVTTWTESSESDFYCVEPWLGLPNAIHHGYGLRKVAPGATETAVCTIIVS